MLKGKQKEFIREYVANGFNVAKAAEKVGMARQNAYIGLNNKIVKVCVALSVLAKNDKNKDSVPTLEWTIGEMREMYDTVKSRVVSCRKMLEDSDIDTDRLKEINKMIDRDEKMQSTILKQITDYHNKFGEMLDEEFMRISRLSIEELVDTIQNLSGEVVSLLKKEKWYEIKDIGNGKQETA